MGILYERIDLILFLKKLDRSRNTENDSNVLDNGFPHILFQYFHEQPKEEPQGTNDTIKKEPFSSTSTPKKKPLVTVGEEIYPTHPSRFKS